MKEKSIAIGNQVFTVRLLPTDQMAVQGVYGLVDGKRFTIEIDDSLPLESRVNTLLHELTHVFTDSDVGSKNHDKGVIDVELACNLVANGMQDLIINNRASFTKLISWLSK